jgi:hypothetical protein
LKAANGKITPSRRRMARAPRPSWGGCGGDCVRAAIASSERTAAFNANYDLSRTSRTLFSISSRENGFARKSVGLAVPIVPG